jgi:hypothetical protein
MLRIRGEQMESFSKALGEVFECSLVAHVSRIMPDRCKQLGEDAVRQLIRQGLGAASTFGIDSQYEQSRYVDLAFVLGPGFPAGPEFAWAAEVLNHAGRTGEQKMDELYRRIKAAAGGEGAAGADDVAGEDGVPGGDDPADADG